MSPSLVLRWCCVLVVIIYSEFVCTLDNGLALTPPMGWMSWERYRCITDCELYPDDCISEKLAKNIADAMVSGGFRDAGYEYVIIDDCWLEKDRDPITHELIPDRMRFPNGIKDLADYIHSKGLKIGIYQDYGTQTCAGYPGIIKHMKLDAETFGRWDIDYVKIDGCNADVKTMNDGYPEFGRYLNETGRPMVYSCSWPVYQEEEGIMPNYEMLKTHCNLWRNWDDIQDSVESLRSIIDYFAANQSRIQPHAGPGHFNDPDMLLIGNYGLSFDQSKVQMAIWSILAAPLLISTDLKHIRSEFADILLNGQIIAVNQDVLGIQGIRVRYENDIEWWVRPITPIINGFHSYAVAWASRRDDGAPYTISVKLTDLRLTNKNGYHVLDLYDETNTFDIATPKINFNVRINPSGVVFYKFTPRRRRRPQQQQHLHRNHIVPLFSKTNIP